MEIVENVACTICGCVCDDLRMTLRNGRIVQAEGACCLSESWFLEQGSRKPAPAQVRGHDVPLKSALSEAADILRHAASPLIYGLSRSSTDGQRAAIALAEHIGATIDTTASLCHANSVMALQEVGEVTCTLGEVKNRADLVVFWGANPVESHPRHLERYSLFPPGRFVPHGRQDRTLVVVDVKSTATSEMADLFLRIPPGSDFEVLATLRSLVRGVPVTVNGPVAAVMPQLQELAARMKTCKYGIVFFGLGLSMTGLGQHNVEALLLLVTDLNRHARFCARRLRIPGDVTGADTVLTWQTGFPFCVNLSRGYPRYNPGEYSAQAMLERQEVDACLFVGSEGVARFSAQAQEYLHNIPTIVLDHPTIESYLRPTIRFTTAVYGIHEPGTAYRMDGVPIPLRAFLPSDFLSDCDVLQRIEANLHSPTSSKKESG